MKHFPLEHFFHLKFIPVGFLSKLYLITPALDMVFLPSIYGFSPVLGQNTYVCSSTDLGHKMLKVLPQKCNKYDTLFTHLIIVDIFAEGLIIYGSQLTVFFFVSLIKIPQRYSDYCAKCRVWEQLKCLTLLLL